MSDIRATTLRLRATTIEMLQQALDRSPHRSMAALADEILDAELRKRGHQAESDLDRMIDAARRES